MAKSSPTYVCQACGAVHSKWAGRCDACGEWNTLVQEQAEAPLSGAPGASLPKGRPASVSTLKGEAADFARTLTGIGELDRVAGGGFVAGSGVLIGGDPGIGKSTLLLQAVAALALAGVKSLYVSGEEAIAQIRLRAQRLGLTEAPVLLASETNVADILATVAQTRPALVVIDSIQTLWLPSIEAAPGTVSQLRAGAEALIRHAKQTGACVLLVGHVTKEGQIAGPKVIEHMVDTVLYFEGDRGHAFRILRAVKNRFGPTDEIGVFEMSDKGLAEVANPSRLFIGSRENNVPGSAVFAGIEGTRPLLMEVQALVTPSPLGTPRRAVVGWDTNRLAMVIAVLEARAGVRLSGHDVYLNIAGGLRVREPAADLAVAAALISSLVGRPLPADSVVFGEIALSGAVRPVGQTAQRLKEAQRLGLTSAVVAESAIYEEPGGLAVRRLSEVAELAAWISAQR